MKSVKRKLPQKDIEKTAFILLFLTMAVYYGYRLFALTPWYDELYTYYSFISKGPVYAAIHWPLPNNHVGYSVLSGFLDYLGNPYIGLRGVSYLCALANMVLLFVIGRNFLQKGLSLTAVVLYVTMNLVNQQAVQGRGYTLAITCMLSAFLCLIYICRDGQEKKRYYVVYALSLTLALWAITSNVYFVLILCLTGGFYLLYRSLTEAKEGRLPLRSCPAFGKLIRLILASLAAAVMTIGLYTIIWLAIGSNLLIKNAESAYYGMGHISMILKAPLDAVFAGAEYMLATPYIQSVSREEFAAKVFDWLMSLFGWYYDFMMPQILLVLVGAGILAAVAGLLRGMRKKEKEALLLPILLICGTICTPLFLTIQSTLPYYRVFVYGGVIVALLLVYMVYLAAGLLAKKKADRILPLVSMVLCTLALAAFVFLGENHHGQYSMAEAQMQDAFAHGKLSEAKTLCVTDCNQQYLLKFLYDIDCENKQIEGADRVLLDKRMINGEWTWEFYHSYDTIPWDYIENQMEPLYENEGFVLYTKK